MSIAIVTGAAGLVGSETARALDRRGLDVVGIDNDLRAHFFGAEASTDWNRRALQQALPRYRHVDADIRDQAAVERLFAAAGRQLALVVHCAAQPSHDWAARDPLTDFSVNATGTVHLLEATRRHAPEAVFIFTSTNKVYGDAPNELPLQARGQRFECAPDHPFAAHGIDETMRLDRTQHSLFGASKLAADVMVQEYGRTFGLRTGVFRGGCLTGPAHSGTELHGFLAYLTKCQLQGRPYTVFGHGGRQVRDNIHSADLVEAFWQFFLRPRPGEVYNLGGGRRCNCSILEATTQLAELCGRALEATFVPTPRRGDHMWWISDTRRFEAHYPDWRPAYGLPAILAELLEAARRR